MTNEEKPAGSLPPLPWRANESKTRILDAEGEQIAQITCPNWGAVASLLLRAPQVEIAAREFLASIAEMSPASRGDYSIRVSGEAYERLRMALGGQR